MDEALLVDVEEAARRLGIGRTALYDLLNSGRIESVKLGRSRRIPTDALERFVTALRREHDTRDARPVAVLSYGG